LLNTEKEEYLDESATSKRGSWWRGRWLWQNIGFWRFEEGQEGSRAANSPRSRRGRQLGNTTPPLPTLLHNISMPWFCFILVNILLQMLTFISIHVDILQYDALFLSILSPHTMLSFNF
jgi:hypothetical protein